MKKNGAELNKLKNGVERWRRTKSSRREAMPEALWREAVRLSGVYSVGRLSAELGIHRGRLSARLPRKGVSAEAPGHFVSVELPKLERAEEVRDCLCEWRRRDGARLRVRIGAQALNGVVAAFLKGQA